MDNTFIKIGQVIRKEKWLRIKYHPFLFVRNLGKKNNDGTITPDNKFAIHELHVDMDNNNVVLELTDAIYEKINIIRFALSNADVKAKYLIGNCVIEKKKILDELTISSFRKNYVAKYKKILLNENSFISRYRHLLENHISLFSELISRYDNNETITHIALIIRITYNGETKFAHEFIECLDEIDEMFLQASYVKNKGYVFLFAFYTMFNYGKYITNGVNTKYEGSIPYFEKDDFLSLYYARSIYNSTSYYINTNYSISIFPNCDNLTMYDIEDLMFKGKDIFDFNYMCDKIETFINQKKEVNIKEKLIIPLLLKFDVYYRYKLGNAGNQNMLRLSGIRYSQLLKIRDHIDANPYYPKWYDKKTGTEKRKRLCWILSDLYQDYNGSSDKYVTTIIHTLENIYQGKYIVPQQAEFCVLDRSEHLARIGKMDEYKKTWNKLFNIYKFLKTMENLNFVSELTANPSYKLGVELAKFEAGWKKDRENLKKTIDQFTGNISRTIYSIKDIIDYYNDLVERLTRNDAYLGNHNDLLFYLHTIKDSEFEKNMFIFGYNTEKCTYKPKNVEAEEEVFSENMEEE